MQIKSIWLGTRPVGCIPCSASNFLWKFRQVNSPCFSFLIYKMRTVRDANRITMTAQWVITWKKKIKVKAAQSCPDSCDTWTVGLQAPLSMEFSRQESWSGSLFPPPGDIPDPGIKPASHALAGRFFTTEPPGKPCLCPNFLLFLRMPVMLYSGVS